MTAEVIRPMMVAHEFGKAGAIVSRIAGRDQGVDRLIKALEANKALLPEKKQPKE
jgi:hypothetical protein